MGFVIVGLVFFIMIVITLLVDVVAIINAKRDFKRDVESEKFTE